ADSTANVIITVIVKPTIKLIYTNETTTWMLFPTMAGNETRSGLLTIKANTDWLLIAEDISPETSGYMTEWDGERYSSSKLALPLVVSAERKVALPVGGVIQTGSRTTGQQVDIFLIQRVLTEELPKQGNYRIAITLRGSPLV
ncbi:MAG: hypothetical protein JW986_05085, partial [Methanotrichaceae archaeon]|nr:hypothetical protein [Methanotrichaceae archaeon]